MFVTKVLLHSRTDIFLNSRIIYNWLTQRRNRYGFFAFLYGSVNDESSLRTELLLKWMGLTN
ncbi:hypothetical protein [Fictibacillus sp. BK138]|uniref:hypothetical protein n=1 Tax=Fictibacillus sp. BK138 TaxID=2512121 RepID=UPI001028BE65|nr:hypothetical protein [Fictibacillus sp. BK138]